MAAAADRNLLFGVVALQMDFISREALITAMNAWVLEKSKSLGEILLAQQALTPSRHALLSALVEEHIKQHGDDPQRSLQSITSVSSVREELEKIADLEVQASLAQMPGVSAADEATQPPERTLPLSAVTSSGIRFRFLRPWREGGLGKVSVAHDEELHREVALKEIKYQHAQNRQSRERFLLEAEITGALEHPGIVPVYGLGHYGDGRPFYAMRFVRGDSLEEAIARFHGLNQESEVEGHESATIGNGSDKPRRSTGDASQRSVAFRELLGRFIDVCNAVAYAHSRGVLHRDLKPGNVILGKYGETLVVDWGLAKVQGKKDEAALATDEAPLEIQSGSGSAPTRMGALIGTPAFMSPEQAEGRVDLLGPASDVYSLGATLYAILTGVAPFTDRNMTALLAKVRKGEFPRPRQTDPKIPRGLEAICLKAMALSRAVRYATPIALADDLEHWLADEPVNAYQEPAWQRIARWTRRHRGVTQTIILGLVTITIASIVAAALIGKARQIAVRESITSQTVTELLVKLFRGTDPLGLSAQEGLRFDRGEEDISKITGRELLDRGVDRIRKNLPQELDVRARLLDTIGSVYIQLGDFSKASEILREAVDVRQKQMMAPANDLELLKSMHNLAYALHFDGKKGQAERLYRETLAKRQKILGKENMDVTSTMFFLAILLGEQERYAEAEDLMQQTIDIRTKLEGPRAQSVALANAGMAGIKLEQNDFEGASPYLIEAATNFQNFNEAQPGLIVSDYQKALQLAGQGNTHDAVSLMKKTLERITKLLGPRHPFVAWVTADYGKCLMEDGQSADAEKTLREALGIAKLSVGPKHYKVRALRVMLAQLYFDTGRFSEAENSLRENLRVAEETAGPRSDEYASALNNIATFQAETDTENAKATIRDALAIAKLRGYSPTTAMLISHYTQLLERKSDQYLAAQAYLDDELAAARQADPRSFATGLLARELGRIYYHQKSYKQAEANLRESCEILANAKYGGRDNLARAKALLGGTLLALGQPEEAQTDLVLAWGWFRTEGQTLWAKDALQWLLELREQQRNEDEAAPLRQRLKDWHDKSKGEPTNLVPGEVRAAPN
jgi:serine/threonine protein kinase